MTLIAAFRCHESVVICADSQETAGHYRVSVDKTAPQDAGEYQVVVGGSGDYGSLIDGLAENLVEEVRTWEGNLGIKRIKSEVRGIVKDYYDDEVASFPLQQGDNKEMRFIFCLRRKTDGSILLWELNGTAMTTVSTYSLIG